jgi:hypothetical protein
MAYLYVPGYNGYDIPVSSPVERYHLSLSCVDALETYVMQCTYHVGPVELTIVDYLSLEISGYTIQCTIYE